MINALKRTGEVGRWLEEETNSRETLSLCIVEMQSTASASTPPSPEPKSSESKQLIKVMCNCAVVASTYKIDP